MGASREKKDIVEKEFVAFPDIAADVINVLLYQGERAVDERSLMAGPTESVYQGKGRLRNQYEDICKYETTGGAVNLVYLIANQSRVDDVEDWMEEQGIGEEDEVTVCELFDQYERKGRREGKIEGLAEGERRGLELGERRGMELGEKRGLELGEKRGLARGEAGRLVKDVESAMNFFKVTLEKACEGLGTTVSGYEEARKICVQGNEAAL